MIIKAKDWRRKIIDADKNIQNQVAEMLADIEQSGDSAIEKYALKFDQTMPKMIPLKPFEDYQLAPELANSIRVAAKRIEKFAEFQLGGIESKTFSDEYGSYGQQVMPLKKVGAYIPGGRFPLISTALMTLIPAKVAGCPVRVACSPSINPAILAAASLAGATQFIQLGGVQAIGALSFGCFKNSIDEIKPVDIIVGPGNAWVNQAKKIVQSRTKIDGLAGPSELMVLADGKQNIQWITLDTLAQAEHDPLACSIIVSDDLVWLESMQNNLLNCGEAQKLIAEKQITLVFADSPQQMLQISEDFSPEHLMLCHQSIEQTDLSNYGSLFIGANSAVALGDYISGPNHTLPTLGYARQYGGLSVLSFIKIATTQTIFKSKADQLFGSAMCLAKAEGLTQHYLSLSARIE